MKITRIEDSYQFCGVQQDSIIYFIQEEWVRPAELEGPGLDEEDLARIRLIRELREDFGVNDEGMPIILRLVDQLNRLHLEIEKIHSQKSVS